MEMSIRRATLEDISTIIEMNGRLYSYENARGFYQGSYDLNWTYSDDGIRVFQQILGDKPENVAFIAELNNAIGFLVGSYRDYTYREPNRIAEIDIMFVEEDYRRQGVGSALVDAFKQWAHDHHAARLRVGAFAGNTVAAGFYQKCGFSPFDTIFEMPS